MKRRALLLSVTLNLAFLAGLLALVRIKGGFDYLWVKTSSMIRGQGFSRDYNPHYFHRKELFARMPRKATDVLFVGDSLVEHCEWAELLEDPHVRNRGILGDDVLGILHRLEEDLKLRPEVPPRKIYLMMGINDLFLEVSEDRILTNYDDILERIRIHAPDCKLVVHGLLPIDERLAPKPVSSTTIRSLNAGLRELCLKREIKFVDTFEAFDRNADGRLDERYSRDGLHLNGKGYLVWKQLLQKAEGGKK